MTDVERPEIVPLSEKLYEELDAVQRNAIENQELVEPNDEERKNGWTAETLTAYLTERLAGQSLTIDVNSIQRRMGRRPSEQNHRYRPHRWRE